LSTSEQALSETWERPLMLSSSGRLFFGGEIAKVDESKKTQTKLAEVGKSKNKQTPKAAVISAPVDSQTTRVTRSSTAAAKNQSSSVFVSKVPSLHSSDSGSSSKTASSSTHNVRTRSPLKTSCYRTNLIEITPRPLVENPFGPNPLLLERRRNFSCRKV